MRTVHDQYAPLLEGTVELIIKCYAAVHYAKLLDSAAQVCVYMCMCGHGVTFVSIEVGKGVCHTANNN